MLMWAPKRNIWPGLSKLIEECGEVCEIVGAVLDYQQAGFEGGVTALRARLEEEIADAMAAAEFVVEANRLEPERVAKYVAEQLMQQGDAGLGARFVTIPWHQLPALIAKAGKVSQIAGKLCAFPVGEHPDGQGCLRARLGTAIAELLATADLAVTANGLDDVRILTRVAEKTVLFQDWFGPKVKEAA